MSILIDTSYLYALYNVDDPDHENALRFAHTNRVATLVPIVVLPEVTFLFMRDTGYLGVSQFVRAFSRTNTPLESVDMVDLQRVADIMQTYRSAEFDLVDCCVMALAERLNITKVCTLDRTDFSIFKPKHCAYLELLP